jgi:hypothetical protein
MKLLMAGILMCIGTAQADEPLQSRVLLGGKVTMLAPRGLVLMSDADKSEKYPGQNAPAYVLTNEDWSVNIAFDHKQIPMESTEVGELEQPIRQQMAGAKINSSGMRKINGSDFLVIDADVTMPDDLKVHNLIAMTSLDGRMLVISYNCVLDFDSNCGAIGPRLIESIVLKPKAAAK